MKRLAHSTAAFSLVEITLALGVASIFLIAVFGLLPVGVQINQKSTSQTDATAIMSNVIADMRATPGSSSTSTEYNINLTAGSTTMLLFRDTLQLTSLNNARYRLFVRIPANPAGTNAARFAYLRVTWPAAVVDPTTTTPAGLTETFAAFSRN